MSSPLRQRGATAINRIGHEHIVEVTDSGGDGD
jgi:hypothetical protein